MLSGLALAVLLAQAEPAPPEPGTRPPVPVPAPPSGPAAMAVASAAPSAGVALHARAAWRPGASGNAVPPAVGFSLGVTIERRLLATADELLELGVAGDFFYDRFSKGVPGSVPDPVTGMETAFDGTRSVSQTSFAALATAALRARRVRPWLAAGAGLTVAHFASDERELRDSHGGPGEENALQPLVRAAAGVDIAFGATLALVIRADYSHVLTRPTFATQSGQHLEIFGDLADAGLGVRYSF